jgi:hypothetical protein
MLSSSTTCGKQLDLLRAAKREREVSVQYVVVRVDKVVGDEMMSLATKSWWTKM